ncbi:hypothetical protein E4T66_13905 [Sinimarinibacterium sp. CAU 1509]|uniref:hypothetical protein n=1 Tax=Sinimarinibacterium sp. CAU 1509 TaxID=2562283 RepID=UPI0010AC8F5C|nr:hypothetical protein [Sinimarinibacterium sp. CAU 1509]TJY59472.1 hypothetical protein E4T66_13905 [Sinimarinibacterium sp. CAU 1509]
MQTERLPTSSLMPGIDAWRPQAYSVHRLDGRAEQQRYLALLEQVYAPLGFLSREILPGEQSRCFGVEYHGTIVGIFRLSEVTERSSPYFSLEPAVERPQARLLEVNNVVIATPMRATILLGMMLYAAAREAHALGYDYIVGMTRAQTLRFFVDFGVVPVDHAPLHLLGRPELQDFVIYYDTGDATSIAYMHERARRWFHQQYVMRCIQDKYLRPQRKTGLTARAA